MLEQLDVCLGTKKEKRAAGRKIYCRDKVLPNSWEGWSRCQDDGGGVGEWRQRMASAATIKEEIKLDLGRVS